MVVRTPLGTFSLTCRPDRDAVYLSMAGEVDIDSEPALDDFIARASRQRPGTVLVDLAEVSFASCTLLNFCARLVRALPTTSRLALCRPTPYLRRLIMMTSIWEIADLVDHLPPGWTDDPAV
jgi:anti-anti-sigma factor